MAESEALEILGPCGECGAPCTERDLVGNGMESDGLGSWPKLWCDACINKSLDAVDSGLSRLKCS